MPRRNTTSDTYEKGQGVNQDDAEALRWYRKAADRNDASSEYRIGMFYAEGRGVPRDLGQTHAWMEEARTNGNSRSIPSMPAMGRVTSRPRNSGLPLRGRRMTTSSRMTRGRKLA
jgi:uncharacterized protein